MASVSIRKRNKYYEYTIDIGKINGKRKRVSKSGFKTKKECEIAANDVYNEYLNCGNYFKEKEINYSEYLDYWINNYCKNNLKYNTICAYKTIIEKYLKPDLGLYRLAGITSVKLNSYINEFCQKHTFSRSYYKNILKVIKGSFRDACDIYGFIKYNPTITLKLPKMEVSKKEKHIYSLDEINRILERFKDNDTFTCSFLTSCYTGMRTSEVFALTWDDVNLENGIIYVKHNVYDKPKDDKGRWFINSTKTINGIRTLHMCDTLLIALKNYKNKQIELKRLFGNKYHYYHLEESYNEFGKVIEHRIVENENNVCRIDNCNLIFTRADGKYCGTDIIRKPFEIIHKEMGIENCRFYDLRGSYATKILYGGAEIRDVADLLGHSKIETTENYYITSSNESLKETVKIFDNIIKSDTIEKIIKYS